MSTGKLWIYWWDGKMPKTLKKKSAFVMVLLEKANGL